MSQLEELGLAVEKEGQDLLEVMETVTRRTLENRASGQCMLLMEWKHYCISDTYHLGGWSRVRTHFLVAESLESYLITRKVCMSHAQSFFIFMMTTFSHFIG